MALLIDGYNLLHVTGIFGRGIGPGTLERSRGALLNFLAQSLDEKEIARTIVVFDAKTPPWGAPRRVNWHGITVLFAANYDNADALIEEVIAADSAPKRLTVVSSDHRLHIAARKRKAKPIDSDKWYASLVKRRQTRQLASPPSAKPDGPLPPGDIEFWLAKFGETTPLPSSPTTNPAPPPAALPPTPPPQPPPAPPPWNPFPPGYGADIRPEDV